MGMTRLLITAAALAMAVAPALSADKSKPRLVVMVVVDQLRGDYITRLAPHFSSDGIGRMIRDGAWYDHAHYRYGMLATGPGHASLSCGATPSVHGIVGNDWYDRESERELYCCDDGSVRGVGLPKGEKAKGRSPKNLMAVTLADTIKTSTGGRGQVWSVALKDRAAILCGGKKADGAIWWDNHSGLLVTSSYYGEQLAPAIEAMNNERFVDRFFKTEWRLLLPADVYRPIPLDGLMDESIHKRTHTGTFPKVLGDRSETSDRHYYDELYLSPMANELVFEAGRRLVESRRLGLDDDVDLLVLGLSANDIVGHRFGPSSAEVMDCTLRTDRMLGAFFSWLDQRVGLDRCVVALSSDHGVGPIVEYSTALGAGGGRFDSKGLEQAVESAIENRFGPPNDGHYVLDLLLPWIYLNEGVLRASNVKVAEAARVAAQTALSHEGVSATYTEQQIREPQFVGSDDLRRNIANSYHPRRSGQVYVHWQRYWYKTSKIAGHGAAYDYDQHVPVMLMGPGVKPGRFGRNVCPTSLTASICAVLGIGPAQTMNRELLDEALSPRVAASEQSGTTGK